jgi:hypothetical protein
VERDPRAVFERLFGDSDSTDRAAGLARIKKERSILDSVSRDVSRLQAGLGASDRSKIGDYLESVRDVERRIQKAEEQSDREVPEFNKPAGIPDSFEEHIALMFDLQVLAYQVDLTRVITFMVGRETSNRTYPQIGVRDGHHSISHHGNDPEKVASVVKIDTYHTTMLARFLEKLASTPDGEGSLLDSMMLLYGSGHSNGDHHDPRNLPILLAGGGAGKIRGGRHNNFPKGTSLSSLHLTLLRKLGVDVERFGDAEVTLDHLSEV